MRKDAVITLRVPRPTRRRLETLARKEGRSLSQQIERLIESGLRGRIGVGPADVLQALRGRPGYAVLALDAEQALEFGTLVGIEDPMDRMVWAAARVSGGKLVRSDGVFDGLGVERVRD